MAGISSPTKKKKSTMATEHTWEVILKTNYADLLWLIDTENGLEGEFKKRNLFTKIQHDRIWGINDNTIKRNGVLLDLISKGDFERFQTFCEALIESGQISIVTGHLSTIKEHWSSRDVGASKRTRVDDPRTITSLRDSYGECLRQNWNLLLTKIDNCQEIEAQLKSRQSLTEIQLTLLHDKKERLDKVLFLLKLLEKGSEKLFDDFCEILKLIKKDDLVEILRQTTEAQRALDNIPTNFLKVELQIATQEDGKGKLLEIELAEAYAVSNGIVKGRVLIFSNREVEGHKTRIGTEYDERNLQDFFKEKLKFKTDVYRNFTSQKMRQQLTEESGKEDLANFDLFIVFLLSHGLNKEIYGADGRTLKTNEITDLLDGEHCRQLEGKPKLIFIQACRFVRSKKETSVQTETVEQLDQKMNEVILNDPQVKADSPPLPYHKKADMAIFYATVKGEASYRNEKMGTYFIRYLLDVFTKKAHKDDVVSMVTEAMRLVHDLDKRQLGEQIGKLLRKVYLVI